VCSLDDERVEPSGAPDVERVTGEITHGQFERCSSKDEIIDEKSDGEFEAERLQSEQWRASRRSIRSPR
jgi:hypothetical protein